MDTQFRTLNTRPMIFPTKGIYKWLRHKPHVPIIPVFYEAAKHSLFQCCFESKTGHSEEDVNSGHYFISNTAP